MSSGHLRVKWEIGSDLPALWMILLRLVRVVARGRIELPTPVFQTCALPTELPGRCSVAGTTGFEPATSGLTGRRELQASPRPRGPEAVHLGHPLRLRGLGEYRAAVPGFTVGSGGRPSPSGHPRRVWSSASGRPSKGKTMSIGTITRRDPTISVTSAKSAWSNMVDPMISSCL